MLFIGMQNHNYTHSLVNRTSFEDSTSLLDYDIIIWNPTRLITDYGFTKGPNNVYKVISSHAALKLSEDIARRKKEMIEALDLGRTLFIIVPNPEKYQFPDKVYSLTELMPLMDMVIVEASGSAIEFRGEEPFKTFWQVNMENFRYSAFFEKAIGEPILYIKDTQRVVGLRKKQGNGNIVFIPDINLYNPTIFGNFINSIIELVEKLNEKISEFIFPDWCQDYKLPDESCEINKLNDIESKLMEIESLLNYQRSILLCMNELKILFSGDGRNLEKVVGRIFSELGFEVEEGLPGRDDLILKYKDRIAVVEIKGVSKSAAEKHARQLEAWVSEYYLKNSISPKGILIINAYKDIPLDKRDKNPFPVQMASFSENRNHCLMTGLQLLGLYLECKSAPTKREEMIDAIFNTNGVLDKYTDWPEFLLHDKLSKGENEINGL